MMNRHEPKHPLRIAAFDFANKTCHSFAAEDFATTNLSGLFLWIDLDYAGRQQVDQFTSLNLLKPETLQDILKGEPETRLVRHNGYLHLVLSGCQIDAEHQFTAQRLDLVLYEGLMLTAHQGDHFVTDTIRCEYQADFERFAKTSSFLVFEFWDALIEHYAEIQRQLEIQVERMQGELVGVVDDRIFKQVSAIGANLLHFRGILMPTRTLLTEMAGRRSHLISEATQFALNNIVGTLERVLQDVLVDREILAQSLNLHLSMVSHRTNQAMSKLTIISIIFLPLTFLCGVYGMNFRVFPELEWYYGYAFFWMVCCTIVAILLFLLHRNRLL